METNDLTAEERTEQRATWEAFSFAVCPDGEHVNVSNHSHGDENAHEHTYTVEVWDEPVSCTCPDYKYRHRTCKHMKSVSANEPVMMACSTRVATDGGTATISPETETEDGQADTETDEITCPHGEEDCCGVEGITVLDDGEEFEHEGQFPCFECFMTACRTADAEVLA